MSLPGLFGTTLETTPANIPYLFAHPRKAAEWRSRINGHGLKVGLVWAGSPRHPNDRNRSCELIRFAPLARLPEVTLYGLQKDEASKQIERLPDNMRVTNLGDHIDDFSDTAAAIENLDLIISVDTAVAHLAGAMGKPVWVLLTRHLSDWRWLVDREDSPWYPTMRLFRQPEQGDWNGLMLKVVEALDRMTRKRVR